MKNTLLVVDDDKSVLAALTKLLHLEGYEVLSARTGAEAVELFSGNSVDLTILDLNLGEESGWTVLERMNRIKPSVPTVIITAEFGQRANAISARAEAFVEKPIDVPRFLETIREILATADRACFNKDTTRKANCRFLVRLRNPLVALLAERYSAPMTLSEALRSVLDCREAGNDPHPLALRKPGPDASPQAAAPEPRGLDNCRKRARARLRRWGRGLQKADRT